MTQRPLESLKLTSPKLSTRPCLAFLVETPAKSVAGAFPLLLLLPPDQTGASSCDPRHALLS